MGNRSRRPRSRGSKGPLDDGLKHSPLTVEGQIEGLGRFGRGLAIASKRRRRMAKGFLVIVLVSFGASLIDTVVMVWKRFF